MTTGQWVDAKYDALLASNTDIKTSTYFDSVNRWIYLHAQRELICALILTYFFYYVIIFFPLKPCPHQTQRNVAIN